MNDELSTDLKRSIGGLEAPEADLLAIADEHRHRRREAGRRGKNVGMTVALAAVLALGVSGGAYAVQQSQKEFSFTAKGIKADDSTGADKNSDDLYFNLEDNISTTADSGNQGAGKEGESRTYLPTEDDSQTSQPFQSSGYTSDAANGSSYSSVTQKYDSLAELEQAAGFSIPDPKLAGWKGTYFFTCTPKDDSAAPDAEVTYDNGNQLLTVSVQYFKTGHFASSDQFSSDITDQYTYVNDSGVQFSVVELAAGGSSKLYYAYAATKHYNYRVQSYRMDRQTFEQALSGMALNPDSAE